MIDTIRLILHKTPRNRQIYSKCLKNCKQRVGWIVRNEQRQVVKEKRYIFKEVVFDKHTMRIINGDIVIPSSEYKVGFQVREDSVIFEFSLPKFLYGTNVLQTVNHFGQSKTPYYYLIKGVSKFFNEVFYDCTVDYGAIEITRFDFCFNQIFDSYEQSIRCLDYFKLNNSQNSDIKNYKYGLIELTTTKYFKIYHKGAEFEKKDRHKFNKDYENELFDIAQKTLRFERKFTNRNISYTWNKHVLSDRPKYWKEYLKYKKDGKRIPKKLRGWFENTRNFTLGTPNMESVRLTQGGNEVYSKDLTYVKLQKEFFNHFFYTFLNDCKKRYTVRDWKIDAVMDLQSVSNRKMGKYAQMYAVIKTYKSLKRAYELKKIGRATYYRWKAELKRHDIDEQDRQQKIEVKQDWTYSNYKNEILRYCIDIRKMGMDL